MQLDFSVKLSSCICSCTDRAVLAVGLCQTCLVCDKAQWQISKVSVLLACSGSPRDDQIITLELVHILGVAKSRNLLIQKQWLHDLGTKARVRLCCLACIVGTFRKHKNFCKPPTNTPGKKICALFNFATGSQPLTTPPTVSHVETATLPGNSVCISTLRR